MSASDATDSLSSSQRVLIALKEARARLAALQQEKSEPIAILGMGCRFPGGADSPEAFWRLLREGRDAITETPAERWDVDAYYDPDPDAPGKTYARQAGWVEGLERFDAAFFGISPREAASLDPQQRLLLEVTWEALERAGQVPAPGSRVGVFIGIGQNDYAQLQLRAGDPARIGVYDGTGNGLCFAAGRLSYVMGWQGPNLAVDTACSASLVALHLAVQSLRARECDMALAGGVHLTLTPEVAVFLARARALAPDGRCKAFAAEADGFGRGEGGGVVVLKRLTDALAAGDPVLALIRGSAVNHDGPSSGLTVPNALAQQALLRQALDNARVAPEQIGYVEAHGTGTVLGDPLEVEALNAVLGQGRPEEQPLLIGSVKTNIGHLEAAAGMAGLIKVVLALQHGEIPPHLHLRNLNPHIPWAQIPIIVPTVRTPWPAGAPRIAGVSSFGMAGTNVHVVVSAPEEDPARPAQAPEATAAERPLHLLALSAKTPAALQALAERYRDYLAACPEVNIRDIAFTANTGRVHFRHRLAIVAESAAQALERLAEPVDKQAPASALGEVPATQVAFLFTGQGSQYVGMGRQLYQTQPTFRRTLERCAGILDPYLQRPLLEVLYPPPGAASPLDETAYTQPALFALEYALAELWRSWGIEPALVMGHSVGEYVAACLAGVFSLEDGLKLIAARGRLMQALPREGEMVAVLGSLDRVAEAVRRYQDSVAIAAVNGPASVVISGRRQAVQAIVTELEGQGMATRRLTVSHAFHSPLMEPMLAEFAREAAGIRLAPPRLGLIANVSGRLAGAEVAEPDYWCRQIRQPVQFAAGMQTLARQCRIFLEIGPQPSLLGMGRQCLPDRAVLWLPSLRQGRGDWAQLLDSLAALYSHGLAVDWTGFDRDYPRRRLGDLPTYPFQRSRYWVDPPPPRQASSAARSAVVDLLDRGDVQGLKELLAYDLSAEQQALLPGVLAALLESHRRSSAVETSWLYRLSWRPRPLRVAAAKPAGGGLWLLFADRQGVGQALAGRLEEQGETCVAVYADDSPGAPAGGRRIDPTARADFEALLQALPAVPLRGIVHLWSLDTAPAEALTLTLDELARTQRRLCGSVLHLVQALISKGSSRVRAPLWLVTRHAVGIDSVPPALAQAPLWGLGKALALEHPELWGGLVDLDGSEPGAVEALLAELRCPDGEDQVALRPGGRLAARLESYPLPASRGLKLRPDGGYWIVGGLGALGLRVARWLAEQGARHLILSGRRGVTEQARPVLERLQQSGVQVLTGAVDAADEPAMCRWLEEIQASLPPLRGVIHAAGAPGYQALQDLDLPALEAVLRPKVLGGWLLHRLTRDLELDFFIAFSSIASVWGSKGQAHYAAANQFLDALAYYRRGLNLPALSINWGPWAEGGMVSPEAEQWLSRMGVQTLPPLQALALLGHLAGTRAVQAVAARVDWARFKSLYETRGRHALLAEMTATTAPEPPPQPSLIRKRLQEAAADERMNLLVAYLQQEVAAVLRLAPAQPPDPQEGFFAMGMDSLLAVELRNRLQAGLEAVLPATLAFDCPNIAALAGYLAREVFGWQTSVEAQVETLSAAEPVAPAEEDLAAAISQKLGRLEALIKSQ